MLTISFNQNHYDNNVSYKTDVPEESYMLPVTVCKPQ